MHLYAIALGSNQPHHRYGPPAGVVAAAIISLADVGEVITASPTFASAAMGGAGRRFANAAMLLRSQSDPPALLAALKAIERRFGRRRGRRWGARVLDLDILLWSGGRWRSTRPALIVPHPHLRVRDFVLVPLCTIAPGWRVPGDDRVRHLAARLTHKRGAHTARLGRVRSSVGRASDF